MNKWRTKITQATVGFGSCGYANQIVAPDGTTFTVNHQDVKIGDVKTEPLSNHPMDRGLVRQTLINKTGNKPQPDELCEFIIAACNEKLNK